MTRCRSAELACIAIKNRGREPGRYGEILSDHRQDGNVAMNAAAAVIIGEIECLARPTPAGRKQNNSEEEGIHSSDDDTDTTTIKPIMILPKLFDISPPAWGILSRTEGEEVDHAFIIFFKHSCSRSIIIINLPATTKRPMINNER